MNSKTVTAPASKSVSHRMVIGAALAAGTSTLTNVLESDDLTRTVEIMKTCGADIVRQGAGRYSVRGVAGTPRGGSTEPASCYVHESGTTCRLLTAVVACGLGTFRIHGVPRMHERPIGELVAALRMAGADVRYEQHEGFPPLIVEALGLSGGMVTIGLDESSQYLSGLLLAAPQARSMTITVGGAKVVSWPYVGLTLQAMEDFGLRFSVETKDDEGWHKTDWRTVKDIVPGRVRFVVPPGMYRAGDYTVEGDWSSSSYFLAAGAAGQVPVTVRGLRRDSLQGDRAMLDILRRMGAGVAWDGDAVTVSPAPLKGIAVDMGHCPDLVPTVAAVAAFASGDTTISNVGHLRIKECDRLASPAAELARAGVQCEVRDDGLVVHGAGRENIRIAPGTVFSTYADHRMAMSMAVLEMAGQPVTVDDPACVGKSFPAFWEQWKKVSPCV
jgi:3-phosphoshikimate 1-carboxyvinyltransferase